MKGTMKKQILASLLCGAMALSLTVFGGAEMANAADKKVSINVGYENAVTEPAAKAAERWKELVEKKSGGSIELKLFPNSTLGKKNDLIDQMLMGESIITVADGAFLADYGVRDFGLFYAPYAFENSGRFSTASGIRTSATSSRRPAASAS